MLVSNCRYFLCLMIPYVCFIFLLSSFSVNVYLSCSLVLCIVSVKRVHSSGVIRFIQYNILTLKTMHFLFMFLILSLVDICLISVYPL